MAEYNLYFNPVGEDTYDSIRDEIKLIKSENYCRRIKLVRRYISSSQLVSFSSIDLNTQLFSSLEKY